MTVGACKDGESNFVSSVRQGTLWLQQKGVEDDTAWWTATAKAGLVGGSRREGERELFTSCAQSSYPFLPNDSGDLLRRRMTVCNGRKVG